MPVANALDYRNMTEDAAVEDAIPTFSDKIGEARRRLGMSQRELGAQIRTPRRPNGVWNTYVGQIEKGDKVPSDEVVLKLAEVLRLNGAEVLLAAYRARTESGDVRALFAQVEAALHQVSGAEPAKAVSSADETASFSADEAWVSKLTMILNKRRAPEIARLLSSVVGLNERQWRAAEQTLETLAEIGT